jgi:hypothetical protein
MAMIVENNNISIRDDDQLISLIKSSFNESDMKLFALNYKLYIENKNNPDGFIANFDEVYKWIGFSRKDHAKTLLESKNKNNKYFFEINKDYIIKMNKPTFPAIAGKVAGRPVEKIYLTINCFKKFCLKSSTEQAEQIFDYYIKMEEIITNYIENKHNEIIKNNKEMKEILQLKDYQIEENNVFLELKNLEIEDNKKIIELKNQEMENNKMLLEDTLTKLLLKNQEVESFKNKKYEEIEKNKNVYIFSCDKSNIYKIGKSKDVEQRRKQLQTANVDTIIIHYTRPTSDDYLLELIVYSILDQYRCKSNGEHFTANLDYMKMVIDMAEIFFDTLRSTYEYITKEELLLKINENILNQSIIDPYELNINLELNNKLKKTNKKSIIKQNIDDNLVPIIDLYELNIDLELNNKLKKTNKKSIIKQNIDDNLVPITDLNITNNILPITDLSIIESEIKFNFDKDIITWFTNTFKLTENNNDIIKVKDIYKLFNISFHYDNMTKVERRKYNKSYFVEFIEKNHFFTPYYCQRYNNVRSVIKYWKYIDDNNNDNNNIISNLDI